MSTFSLTKDDIIKLAKNNDSSITVVKPKPTSSQVSSNFSYIYYKDYKQKIVSCVNCKDGLCHTSTNGTSNMTEHQKSCTKIINYNNEYTNIEEYFGTTTSQLVPRKIKEKNTIVCTEIAVMVNPPFYLLCGDGFVNLAQTIFDTGKNT